MFNMFTSNFYSTYFGTPVEDTIDVSNNENELHTPEFQSNTFETKLDSEENGDFKVMVNVRHFIPSEVEVKVVDNFVVIHGEHQEISDQHGFVSRKFTKRYQLPVDVDPDTMKATWFVGDVLIVFAPKKSPPNVRVVPVMLAKSEFEKSMKRFENSDRQARERGQRKRQSKVTKKCS